MSPAPTRTHISDRLRRAVKAAPERQYTLAHRIPVHPSTVSAWINGIQLVAAGDPRVIQLGKLVGVPADECFESAPEKGRTR